jgi:hypothetical protein
LPSPETDEEDPSRSPWRDEVVEAWIEDLLRESQGQPEKEPCAFVDIQAIKDIRTTTGITGN